MKPLSVPRRWVMVTGVMRSGTTFVGQVLTVGRERAYVHEPFNTSCGLPGLPTRMLVDDSDLGRAFDLHHAIESITSLQCELGTGIHRQDSRLRAMGKRVIGGRGRVYLRRARLNPFLEVGVIKDPLGVLVAPTIHRDHDVDLVVMVRHPVAWYASLVRHGFYFEPTLRSLVDQQASSPGLMTECERELAAGDDRLEWASVLWNVVYRRLHRELAGSPRVLFVRHEDLSADPMGTFEHISTALDLPLRRAARRRIAQLTDASNPVEARPGRVHGFRRDSRQLFDHRVSSVAPEDRARLAALCGEVAAPWYDRASFDGPPDRETDR